MCIEMPSCLNKSSRSQLPFSIPRAHSQCFQHVSPFAEFPSLSSLPLTSEPVELAELTEVSTASEKPCSWPTPEGPDVRGFPENYLLERGC